MFLKKLIFQQFLLSGEGVVVLKELSFNNFLGLLDLKELIFNIFYFSKGGGLERTDF